ncbi:MAG: RluA family pseudouridine synthase [Verrucomicrobia bacterium]|nr:RluA family pseudouridine synthase [Verrucomicrobiota bacterium]
MPRKRPKRSNRSDRPARRKHQPMGMDILHEDRDVIVVNKAAGLLTIGTGKDGGRTAHAALTDYVKKGNPKSREQIFIVHRLDRDTSGAIVFARTEAAKITLQSNWKRAEKTYLAFVEGHPEPAEDTITTYLAENSARRVFSTLDPKEGKLSHTRYKVIKTVGDRSLMEIYLLTGRKNQIRVHLADKGWPIVGDSKYGRKIRDNKRLALHSYVLSFDHPFHGERMTITAPVPETFYRMAAAPAPEPPREPNGERNRKAVQRGDRS